MVRRFTLTAAAFAAALSFVPGLARAEDGATIFADICSACHQPGGEGAPGVAPSLHSSVWPVLGDQAPRYITLVLLNGLTGRLEVDGEVFNGGMPMQAAMSDEQLAAVANHVLGSFNGMSGKVTTDLVASLRNTPHKAAEIKAIRAGSGS